LLVCYTVYRRVRDTRLPGRLRLAPCVVSAGDTTGSASPWSRKGCEKSMTAVFGLLAYTQTAQAGLLHTGLYPHLSESCTANGMHVAGWSSSHTEVTRLRGQQLACHSSSSSLSLPSQTVVSCILSAGLAILAEALSLLLHSDAVRIRDLRPDQTMTLTVPNEDVLYTIHLRYAASAESQPLSNPFSYKRLRKAHAKALATSMVRSPSSSLLWLSETMSFVRSAASIISDHWPRMAVDR